MTPYEKIQRVFHSKIKTREEIPLSLEQQYFINAVGDFEEITELTLIEESIDDEIRIVGVEEDLKQSEINLIGLMMYRDYLGQKRDYYTGLTSLIGRDIKMTSLGDSKRLYHNLYTETDKEIRRRINRMDEMKYE